MLYAHISELSAYTHITDMFFIAGINTRCYITWVEIMCMCSKATSTLISQAWEAVMKDTTQWCKCYSRKAQVLVHDIFRVFLCNNWIILPSNNLLEMRIIWTNNILFPYIETRSARTRIYIYIYIISSNQYWLIYTATSIIISGIL